MASYLGVGQSYNHPGLEGWRIAQAILVYLLKGCVRVKMGSVWLFLRSKGRGCMTYNHEMFLLLYGLKEQTMSTHDGALTSIV